MRLKGVVAVLGALTALATAGTALASPSVRYGVQDDAWLRYGPGTLDERLDRLESLGVQLVRINVAWSDVEKRRGVRDWRGYDPVVLGLHKHGIEPVLTLHSTPRWANGGRATNWAPTSPATFAAFAAAAAKHYPFVRRWLIWNEPNQRRWLRPTSAAIYVQQLLNPAYIAIHRARPGALVAGGATAPRASTGGVSPVDWIAGMAKAHARLDAYAHHPYPLSPGETPFAGGCAHCSTITMATLDRLVARVERAFGARTRIWLSEYGYQTNPPDRLGGVSVAKQAAYVGQAALRVYLAPRVDMLVHFLLQDERDPARWQSGVLTASGKPKLSYDALALPLAVKTQVGSRTTLQGQVRPGTGQRVYRLQQLRDGIWFAVGPATRTGAGGFFTRVVRAAPGAAFRVVAADLKSPPLLVG